MAIRLEPGKLAYAREKAKREGLLEVTVDDLLFPKGSRHMQAWELLSFVLGEGDVYQNERDRVIDKLVSSFGVDR